jgi:hypothetical protein
MAKKGIRKPKQRVPKQERKNLRLWAEGVREEILEPHLDAYSKALDKGWVQEREYLMRVCNEFHARIDWRTPDHEEPVLRPFEPSAPIIPEELTDEEEADRGARVEELNKVSPLPQAHSHVPLYLTRLPAHSSLVYLSHSPPPQPFLRVKPVEKSICTPALPALT